MTQIEKSESKIEKVRDLLKQYKTAIAESLPKHLTAERMMRAVFTSIQRNPKLLECTSESMIAAILECCRTGLEPDDSTAQAHLVPFWNSKKGAYEVVFIPGYRGLMDLARNSADISTIEARCVYDGDDFDFAFGTHYFLRHRPDLLAGDRKPEELVAVYCQVWMKDGRSQFEVLSRAKIEARKAMAMANKGGAVWVTHYDAMAMKTAVKDICDFLPRSKDDMRLARALGLDRLAEAGIPQELSLPPFDVEGRVEGEETKLDKLTKDLTREKETEQPPPPPDPNKAETEKTNLPPGEQLASPTSISAVMDILGHRNIAWEPPDDLTQGEAMQIIALEKEKDVKKINAKLLAIDRVRAQREKDF